MTKSSEGTMTAKDMLNNLANDLRSESAQSEQKEGYPLTVLCTFCGSKPFYSCINRETQKPMPFFHVARVNDSKAAWQNAAESLPVEPVQKFSHVAKCLQCRRSWGFNGSVSRCPGCDSIRQHIEVTPWDEYFELVAPVEAKEFDMNFSERFLREVAKEDEPYGVGGSAKEKCKAVSKYGCICLMDAGHEGDHDPKCGWGNHKFPQKVAESNPQSSTTALNVTPTFGRPTIEDILQEWSEGRTYGRDSHFIKQFSHHALIYIESLKTQLKPQPDSSSIPEQSFSDEELAACLQSDGAYLNSGYAKLLIRELQQWRK